MPRGFFLYAAGDATAKYFAQTLDPIQFSFARQAGLLVGVLLPLMQRGPIVLRSRRPMLQLLHGALAAVSVSSFFLAIAYIPLADASAMSIAAPFFVTIFAVGILGEKARPARWVGVALCFAGILVVVRPGLDAIHPTAGFALLSAACFAGAGHFPPA